MRRTLACAAVLAVLSACSSSSRSPLPKTSAGPSAGASAIAGASSKPGSSSKPQGSSAIVGGGESANEPGSSQGTAPPPAGGATTGGTITLGIELPSTGPALSSLGFQGDSSGEDPQFIATKLADYFNKTGGILRRKLKLVFHHTDISQGTWASQAQAICSYFTEDNNVFAVASGYFQDEYLADCLSKKGRPILSPAWASFDRVGLAKYRNFLYLVVNGMSLTRVNKEYVDRLYTRGFFEKGAKIGLVRMDGAIFKRITDEIIKPRLAAHGLKLTDEVTMSDIDSVAALGGTAAASSNAILRLRANGVTHILFVEHTGSIPFFFLPAAESQGYHPRYGFHSGQQPLTSENNSPAAQLHRAIGIGWTPYWDVNALRDPGLMPGEANCRSTLKKAGVTGLAARADAAYAMCDELFFLKQGLEAGGQVSAAGLRRGVDKLGTSFKSASALGSRFGPGRNDVADSIADLAFNDGCACWKYVSKPFRVP